jgi:pantetheine-phosphate adenylyltransferase
MSKTKIGVYPGSFDPVTAGHIDIAIRALRVVDKLVIAIAEDNNKKSSFSINQRLELLKDDLNSKDIDQSRIEVISFRGLLVNFVKSKDATIIIRGLRAVSDFEYEFQMSCMNSKLDHSIQTIFLPSSEKLQLVSSKMVKEVVRLGGDIGDFASEKVKQMLKEHYGLV